jgi:thiol-disulfide isomerase/thioredoxin
MGKFTPAIALLAFLFVQACGVSNNTDKNNLNQEESSPAKITLENKIYELSNSKDLTAFRTHYLAGGMVLFKFGATWCGPCRTMKGNSLTQLAKNSVNGNYMILDIDVDHKLRDDWKKFITQFKGNGSSIPNGSIYVNKKRVYTYVGVRSANVLAPILAAHKKAVVESVDPIPSDQDAEVASDSSTASSKLLSSISLGNVKLTIKANKKGQAVSLQGDQVDIDLLNSEQFELEGMTYKIMKQDGIVNFLLLCDGTSCQPIDIYTK